MASKTVKNILYYGALVILAALFIGFLVAYIQERNKNAAEPDSDIVTPSPSPPLDESKLRLEDSVIPINYQLNVRSDHENDAFSGDVIISLEAKKSSSVIRLHCKDLTISKYSLHTASRETVEIKKLETDTDYDLCDFHLAKSVGESNKYDLELSYNGTFKEGQIFGFYKSKFTTVDNQDAYLTATKFEPTYARMAFPCFDEPKFKATFEISVTFPNTHSAISNEIEMKTEVVDEKWSKTTFAKTKPMSTYLVAFIVSDFKFTETRTSSGTRVRVYSRPDQVEKTKYALETAATTLDYYENYTNIEYALNKLDLIGLPQFVSGAMENWGLVTYKEVYILYSPNESSAFDQRSVSNVIAHELAHMWFGNLVTLEWWDHLWLNEGFASYFEYKAQDFVNKTWNVFEQFITSDLHRAIDADTLKSEHPVVSSDLLSPDQITSIFDTITYSKGACIVYMMENVLGKDDFQKSIRKYLKENEFKNTDTLQLLYYLDEEFEKATGISATQFLSSWLFSNGFPLIKVARSGSTVKLSQSVFSSVSPKQADTLWSVVIPYSSKFDIQGNLFMNKISQTFTIDGIEDTDWFKLNAKGNGFYVVNYTDADWKLLLDELQHNLDSFTVFDRANIIFDIQRLTSSSLLTYDALFNLFDYLPNEKEPLPWTAASRAIKSLDSKLTGVLSTQYKNLIQKLVGGVYTDLNINLETDQSKLSFKELSLQSALAGLACNYKCDACVNQAVSLFRKWIDNPKETVIDPSIRTFVYSYGIEKSDKESDWENVWNRYRAEKDATEKSKLMAALTSTESTSLISKLIDYSNDSNIIDNENFFSVQQSIASNSEIGRSMVWDYIKENWNNLVERFTLNDRRLGNYVSSVVSGFKQSSQLQDVEKFFQLNSEAGAGATARKRAIENIKNNIDWLAKNREEVSESLDQRDESKKPWLDWRLDELVRPVHYDVNLTINVDTTDFNGSVNIEVDVQHPIQHLILHSSVNITSSSVHTLSDNTLVSSRAEEQHFKYAPNQFYIIPMEKIILPGTYIARLKFESKLSEGLTGLYVAKYTDSKTNKPAQMATTQFEAPYARKAFPCFDEPQFKATFSISIEHQSKYKAISNMPVANSYDTSTDWKVTAFSKSVPMATYLVAMVVGDIGSKTSKAFPDFSVYTYNTDENLAKTDYALDVGPRIRDFYANKYFNISYPLPKLDMISIPDFSMGAMENWGLITYRDVYVLYDPKTMTSASKMQICSIIAHELAHMWYGNLVTMKWWNDLWLNEGFAQFMMYKSTAIVEPTWNYDEYLVIYEMNRVFEADSSLNTHPILTNVKDENAIQAVFDSVTYAKGASIVRMLENALGAEDFRTGVVNYLKKYSYKNTLTNDLYAELGKVKNVDVSHIMETWVSKDGFPVVTVTQNGNKFSFKQERFLKDFDYSNSSYTWFIPLTYKVIDKKVKDFSTEVKKIDFDQSELSSDIGILSDQLIKFNVDQTGVFITNYEEQIWKDWIKELNQTNDQPSVARQQLSSLDRNNLVIDAFYLARSGRLSYDIALNLAECMPSEESFIVWSSAYEMLMSIRQFATADNEIAFNQWILNHVISTLYDKYNWNAEFGEDLNKKQLQALILNLACSSNKKECLETAREKFGQFLSSFGGEEFVYNPDTLPIILSQTMRTSKENFESLLSLYKESTSTNMKMTFLRALAAVEDKDSLEKLLNNSIDPNFLRPQDFFSFLFYISNNKVGLDLGWEFYQQNYEILVERYGIDDFNLGRAIYRFAKYFITQERREELENFYTKYPKAGASELYRQQALELTDANIAFAKKFNKKLTEYFTKKCDPTLCPWNQYRLNQNVKPTNYDLTFQIDNKNSLFNGTVKIDLTVDEDKLEYLILHAAETLKTSGPTFKSKKGTKIGVVGEGFRYSPLEFYVMHLDSPLAKGGYTLEVAFSGSLLSGGELGLYRGWYEDNGQTVNLTATQFQSIHARKAFPCFDEPSFKSTFDVEIIHSKTMNATLSNMPENPSTKDETGLMHTKFQKSQPMVTYLLAVLVSDFHCSNTESNSNYRICSSRIHPAETHQYALSLTPKIVDFYANLFDINYTLPKLDQVSLPQFSPGAMENWGLITYREKYLLWSQNNTAIEKMHVASVMSHEIAHQWFGNLITCEFWGDLWLNEGFATYLEALAVHSIEPTWNYNDFRTYNDRFPAMLGDSKDNSAPLVRNVTEPRLMSYSSSIVYDKGAVILQMFSNIIGEENFQKSLKSFLAKFQLQTVKTDDLFEELATNWETVLTNEQKKSFFDSWTKKPGFPYINITKTANGYTFVQQRYVQQSSKDSSDVYEIPFKYYTTDAKNKITPSKEIQFLTKESGQLNIEGNFFKANPNFDGFYLVNYPEDHWKVITDQMEKDSSGLSVEDRTELLVSSYLLATENLVSYEPLLNLYKYLPNEKHFVPWYYFEYTFGRLTRYLARSDYKESVKKFQYRITQPHYSESLWTDSTNLSVPTVLFQQRIINLACESGNQACLDDAYKSFNSWKENERLSPNFRRAILSYGIKATAKTEDYEFVWSKLKDEKNADMRKLYLYSLSFIPDSNKMKEYIDRALDERLISKAEFSIFLTNIMDNGDHGKMIFNYFKDNYSMLLRKLPSNDMKYFVSSLVLFAQTSNERDQIIGFAKGGDIMQDSMVTNLNIIFNEKLDWLSKYNYVAEWFAENACDTRCPWSTLRINHDIEPTNYDLTIEVNLVSDTYNGSVNIDVEAQKDFEYIVLHASKILNVDLVCVEKKTEKNCLKARLFRHQPYDYIVIEFDSKQSAGNYMLTFNFEASLLDTNLSGLYISTYKANGTNHKIASTQFEFYDARKVFPCFDEPSFKSTFDIKIKHASELSTTLSNMQPESSVTDATGLTTTKFAKSKKMAPYLGAMVISDFVCKNDTNNGGISYQVCAAHIHGHKLDYALDIAPKTYQHLQKLLNCTNPIEKIDFVAIPDFYYGAMENWGLITFRESALLFHESDTTSAAKIGIASTVTHEIAHFWFGNLVTCEWWDNLWLNEAFARYMQYTSVDSVHPEFQYGEMFLMRDYWTAMKADESGNAHPIIRKINETKQIDNFKSAIIYSKGSCILRMTEALMGHEKFHKSLGEYLANKSLQNAVPSDLLETFDQNFENKEANITAILESWLNQQGYPYINVTEDENNFILKQGRYFNGDNSKQSESSDSTWTIPIFTDDAKFTIMKEKTIQIPKTELSEKQILNAKHSGFYLVNYTPDLWSQWTDDLEANFSSFTVEDRAGFIIDAFQLAHANLLSYIVPLKLTKYLSKEIHVTPWSLAIENLNRVRKYVLLDNTIVDKFMDYLQNLVNSSYTQYYSTANSVVDKFLLTKLTDFACSNKHQKCLDDMKTEFQNWKASKQPDSTRQPPNPNMLPLALKYGIATEDDWSFVWTMYLKEELPEMKTNYLQSLVNFNNEKSIQLLLDQVIANSVVSSSDAYSILNAVAGSMQSISFDVLWQFLQTNNKLLSSNRDLSPKLFTILNKLCGNYFATNTKRLEVENFLNSNPSLGLSKKQEDAILKTIDDNIAWVKAHIPIVNNFIQCGEETCPFTEFRLNPKVLPERYDLEIKVDVDEKIFSGSVKISINLQEEKTTFIILHAASSLNILSQNVTDSESKELTIKNDFRYAPLQFFVLEMEQPLTTGKYFLNFEFNSTLSTDMSGFYLSEYQSENGMKKLASTQFQDIYARRAFPCFDEPSFKSVFHVTVEHKEGLKAVSNNEEQSPASTENGWTKIEFKDSPEMVTYLAAFIINDFKCVEPKENALGKKIQVCASPSQETKGQYSADKVPSLIANYQTKLGQEYSLPKMDLYAIPDFNAGAMENWGLLTFRETALLYDDSESSASDKMYVLSVVAHEIAHMWYGNLITCEWWDNLWLNEGFASYFEYFSVDLVEPDWHYWDLFYITDYTKGLNADASITAHPLIRTVKSPEEIPYISTIIYQKGASILRMFEYVLTTKEFYEQLASYLKDNVYKTVNVDTLFSHLEKASLRDSSPEDPKTLDFLNSWTRKAGFPCLTIKSNEDGSYTISQKRFLANGQSVADSPTWIVPLSYYQDYTKDESDAVIYVKDETQTITPGKLQNKDLPIKFNVDSQGFYIVNYPEDIWQKWINLFDNKIAGIELSKLKLKPQDYTHLLYDAFTLAKANQLPYSTAFSLTQILQHTGSIFTNTPARSFSIWSIGSQVLNELLPFYKTTETSGRNFLMSNVYRKYASSLVKDHYNVYNILNVQDLENKEEDTVLEQRLHATIVAFACAYGHDQCLLEAQLSFLKWRQDNSRISPNVQSTVFRYAIQESKTDDNWNYLLQKYTETNSNVLKLVYLDGLSQTSNVNLLKRLLEKATKEQLVRKQDYYSLYSRMSRTPIGKQVAWDYFKANYQYIRENILSTSRMSTVAGYFANAIYTEEEKTEFEQFFLQNPKTGISLSRLNSAFETIDRNIEWAKRHRQEVFDWIDQKLQPPTTGSDAK